MKTSEKRLISLCIALIMVVGLLVMPGAAATRETVKHYDTYTVLGDSIPAGYGLPDYPVPEPNILDGSRVEGSYPDLLAKAVKAKTFYPMTHCGNRAVDLDWLLNEDAKGDDLTIPFLASSYAIDISDGAGGVSMEKLQAEWPKFEKMRTDTIAAVQEADLITLEIGNNDTLTYGLLMYSIEAALKAAAEAEKEPSQIQVTTEKVRAMMRDYILGLEKGEDILEQFDNLQKTSTLAAGTLDFLLGSMKYALQGMAQFKEYFDKDIARIRELNPDATLVVVGMYNPFNEVTLTKDSKLPVGRLGAMLIAPLNLYMQYQSSQRSEYIFVDVRDPQVHDFPAILSENGISDFIAGLKHGTHPDEVGHAFIAEKILAALPTEEEPAPTPTPTATPDPTPMPTAAPDPTPAPAKTFPFRDVAANAWYFPNVYYVWEHSIMDGMEPDLFAPDGTTTRGQFATVIYRMADKPAVTDAQRAACPFKDLVQDWYKDAVVWCYANGVVNGTSDTTFTPGANITREQMVAMLYRYSGDTAVNPAVLAQFKDYTQISDYAIPAVIWAVENNIVNGMGDGTFTPQGNSTRAQLAAVLSRYMVLKSK